MPPGNKIRGARKVPGRLGEELGQILRDARDARGQSRTELAEEAGVSETTLGALERCQANPTLAYIEALGEVYGVRLRLVAST